MLIVFGGLPGTGKTTLSAALARRLRASYLRVDAIEAACSRPGSSPTRPRSVPRAISWPTGWLRTASWWD
ncbi:MAG: AAA family ATPase [Geodermatophilaceae bacterium]